MFSEVIILKSTFSHIHLSARLILIIGGLLTVAAVAASALLHFGAGKIFDYYFAADLSERLLAASRPIGVISCCSALAAQYRKKQKENE